MNSSQPPLHSQLLTMASGYWLSQCIYVAAKLGIADYLKEKPLSCADLAEATQSDSSCLYRLLRALASAGIFMETEPQHFALTPLAEYLRSDVNRSMRATVIMLGEKEHYQAWGDLLHSIQTGEPAFEHCFGMGVFEYFQHHPAAAEIFAQSMNSFSSFDVAAVSAVYDFSEFQTLVDVGGGYGEMLATLLQQYPHSQGILFDEKYVIDHCQPTLKRHNIAHRCQAVSGNFFDEVPSGGDAYLLKHIIHDWDDQRAITILRNCCRAMPNHSKILVMEMVVPSGNTPSLSKMMDLNMLVMTPGGKERTEAEFYSIFEQAGLQLTRIIETAEQIKIIEGQKISSSP